MVVQFQDADRRILPRWHWLSPLRQVGELAGSLAESSSKSIVSDDHLSEKKRDWTESKSVVAAAELCAAAMMAGKLDAAADAAKFLEIQIGVSREVERLWRGVLSKQEDQVHVTQLGGKQSVAAIRSLLRSGDRDPLRWADLARAYSMLGLSDKALDAMKVAAHLGAKSRMVVRAATRCFVHLRDPERAHHLLGENARTKGDPWMLAAEIALNNSVGSVSKFAKQARMLIDSGRFGNGDLSELRVALGSQEVWFGNARLGRRLLRESLADATENAVAQVAWFARRGEFGASGPDLRTNTASAEAEAWSAFYSRRWMDCLAACSDWWRLEPYSSRAPELGSFVAATVGADPIACVEFAKAGLGANPDSASLLNNYAVGLAYTGQLDMARAAIDRAVSRHPDESIQVALDATRGLVAFRSGNPDHGRLLYRKAIERAIKNGDQARALLAELHLLREEVELAKSSGESRDIPRERLRLIEGSADHVTSAFAKSLIGSLPV